MNESTPHTPDGGGPSPVGADARGPARRAFDRVRRALLGPARSPFEPGLDRRLSLVAFLAWIGLGADGLSSTCYGPEEAFGALGAGYHGLAVFLAAMTAVTVVVISMSYVQIIEAFPSGGGAYTVASRLLGPVPGVVAGTALVVDYVLTISISLASAGDALFSLLPLTLKPYKLLASLLALALLALLNLRGVRESVTVIAPFFLLFVVTHAAAILGALLPRASGLPALVTEAMTEARTGAHELGTLGLALVLLRAYSLGGGTYTGIEAVSNSLPLLREPRVRTARRAMAYMATSLAFTACGILVGYLLVRVQAEPGKTLNAVFFERTLGSWPAGGALVFLALVGEAAILFVAAQTGFVGGPQVVAAMAADSWVPRRFLHLSDRLVRRNGVVLLSLAAAALLVVTRASVSLLVVLYSINVFLGFTLSQAGMARLLWRLQRQGETSLRALITNGVGLCMTAFILVVMLVLKFGEGGWATVLLTGSLAAVCLVVRRHYQRAELTFRRLDEILMHIPIDAEPVPGAPDPAEPTAVVLVRKYGGLGVHTLLSIVRLFGGHFKGVVFLSVGIVDSERFTGPEALDELRAQVDGELGRYVELARRLGLKADAMSGFGIDPVDELELLAVRVRERFPSVVLFAGKLIFRREGWLTNLLHNQTAMAIQSRLHPRGLPVVILPIRAE